MVRMMRSLQNMLSAFGKKLRYLHDDENGQAVVFIALTLLLMVVWVMFVINSGNTMAGKIEMINAADAAGYSGTIWMARGLNTAAILNKTQAYLLAIILLIESMNRTHQFAAYALIAMYGIGAWMMATGFPPLYIAGALIIADVQTHYGFIFGSALVPDPERGLRWVPPSYAGNYYSIDGLYINILRKLRDPLWSVMKVISTISEQLVKVFPVLAQAEAIHMGITNNASIAILMPAIPQLSPGCEKDKLCLPIIQAKEFDALCDPTVDGQYDEGGYYNFETEEQDDENNPTEDIYHFPANGREDGSIDYFRHYLPYYWTGLEEFFTYTPPFVVELQRLAEKLQVETLCSSGDDDDDEMELTITVSASDCYKIETGEMDNPILEVDEKKYTYTAYRWDTQQLNDQGTFSGMINDHYEDYGPDGTIEDPYHGICPTADDNDRYVDMADSQNAICQAQGMDPTQVDRRYLCSNIAIGSTVPQDIIDALEQAQATMEADPTSENLEAYQQALLAYQEAMKEAEPIYGCQCLRDMPGMHQDEHFIEQEDIGSNRQLYIFGLAIEAEDDDFMDNDSIGWNFRAFDGTMKWLNVGASPTGTTGQKPYWVYSGEQQCGDLWGGSSTCCHDIASESDAYERDCCRHNEQVEQEKKCYGVDLVILESCEYTGTTTSEAYTDYMTGGGVTIPGTGGNTGQCPPQSNDNDPDKFGSACRQQEQIAIDLSNTKNSEKVRIQQLDWNEADGSPVWTQHVRYFGTAYQLPRKPLKVLQQSESFEEATLGVFAYGATEIYVPDGVSQNLFQQEWRVRLIPVQYCADAVSMVNMSQQFMQLASFVQNLDSLGELFGEVFNDPVGFFQGGTNPMDLLDEEATDWLINH